MNFLNTYLNERRIILTLETSMRRIFCQVDETEMEWLGIEHSEIVLKDGIALAKKAANQIYWCRTCQKSLTVAPLEGENVES